MKILEQKKRLRQQRSFWLKITVILFVISILFGIFRVFFLTPSIERAKADRGDRTYPRVPPPPTNSLSDR